MNSIAFSSPLIIISVFSLPNNATYTLIGMTATLAGQEMGCICAILLSSTYLSLYVSSCVYISAFLKNVAKIFGKMDRRVEERTQFSHEMEIEYIDMLQLHTRAIM